MYKVDMHVNKYIYMTSIMNIHIDFQQEKKL